MTFEDFVGEIITSDTFDGWDRKDAERAWNEARRTDPIKQQMYRALKYVVDAKGVLIEGVIADEILPAIDAYEGEPLNRTYKADPVKHMLYIALIEACETADVSESIRKAIREYEEEQNEN